MASLKPINPSEMSPVLAPVLVTDEAGLSKAADFLERTAVFGFDLETNVTPTFYDRKIRTIQFGDRNEQYVIDLLAFAGSTEKLQSAQGEYGANSSVFAPIADLLRPHLENYDRKKVGHNLQFEYETLRWNFGILSTGFFDTYLAEKVIHAGRVNFSKTGFWALDDVVGRYCGLEMSKDEQKGFDLATPLTESQINYCALDVRLPMAVRQGQTITMAKDNLMQTANIEFDAISAFGEMHLNGLNVSEERWMALVDRNRERLGRVIDKLDTWFVPVVGGKGVATAEYADLDALERKWRDSKAKTAEDKAAKKQCRCAFMKLKTELRDREKKTGTCQGQALINYESTKMLTAALHRMGFNAKTLPNTKDETLEKLAKFPNLDVETAFAEGSTLDYPVIDVIRLLRSITKRLGTYGPRWVNDSNWADEKGKAGHLSPGTKRIHSRIDQLGAATGRTTSTKPNIQNLPRESEVRGCFTAPEGYLIITLDFNGCELRILAEMSGEKVFIDAFNAGWDVHSVGAEIIFGEKWKNAAEPGCAYYEGNHQKCKCKEHKKLRDQVKALNFGIMYGKGAYSFAQELGITKDEAEKILSQWKRAFPRATKFLEASGNSAKTNMECRTLCGRRRGWTRPTWDDAKNFVEGSLPEGTFATSDQIRKKYGSLFSAIEREGKNGPIQGTNADIAKLAMFYIWQGIRKFGAKVVNFVHDENVVECPTENAEACKEFVVDCMRRAGAVLVKSVVMEAEGNISDSWTK